jgi:hypothetical protein
MHRPRCVSLSSAAGGKLASCDPPVQLGHGTCTVSAESVKSIKFVRPSPAGSRAAPQAAMRRDTRASQSTQPVNAGSTSAGISARRKRSASCLHGWHALWWHLKFHELDE